MNELLYALVVVLTIALWIIEAQSNRIAFVMDVCITTFMTTYVTFGYSLFAGILVMLVSDVVSIMIIKQTKVLNIRYNKPGLAGAILVNMKIVFGWIFKGFGTVLKMLFK